jgi:hypothetical protein
MADPPESCAIQPFSIASIAVSSVECAVCGEPMQSLGQLPIRTGGTSGAWHLVLGEWADMAEGVLPLDVFRCTRCRRVEFYDLDLSLPER